MIESTNPTADNAAVSVLEKPKKQRASKPVAKDRHVFGNISVYSKAGNTLIDLSMFGLSDAVRIGGGGSFVPQGSLRSLAPKVDRANKTEDINYDVTDEVLNVELTNALAYVLAAVVGAAPKCHAKPIGTKGNARKDRIVALRDGNRGKGIRLS